MRTRCDALVVDKQTNQRLLHRCRNTAKIERDGVSFCKVHDPVVLNRRRESQNSVIAARQRDRRRALQDQAIGVEVRKLFRDGIDDEHIIAWIKQNRRSA